MRPACRSISVLLLWAGAILLLGHAGDGGCGGVVQSAEELCTQSGGTMGEAATWPPDCDDDPAVTPARPAAAGQQACLCPAGAPSWIDGKGCAVCKKRSRYVVAVSSAAWADAGWQAVAKKLEEKHQGAIVQFGSSPLADAVIRELADLQPSYIAVVATYPEVGEAFVRDWHQATRRLDSDPYGDAVWSVVTGWVPDDGLRMATTASPLVIRNPLFRGIRDWLTYFPNGTNHDGGDTTLMHTRVNGGPIVTSYDSPVDDTVTYVNALNSNKHDALITSGHANPWTLQLHYPEQAPEGRIKGYVGQLYGKDASDREYDITTTNPKIFWGAGNCLTGKIDGAGSIMLGFLHSFSAVQTVGYVVGTWFGYGGWGIGDFFLPLAGRYTFAQSHYFNNQALLFDERYNTGQDRKGLEYDRDVVVMYGDPAFETRVDGTSSAIYDQRVEYTAITPYQYKFTLTIEMKRAAEVTRAVITPLPLRVRDPIVTDSAGRQVVVTDNVAMVRIWRSGERNLEAGDRWTITFTARPRTGSPKP